MGMSALIAADANPPLPTVAGWYSIMTNDLREAFFKQGAFMVGVFGSILGKPYLPPDQMPRAPLAAHESDGPDPYWCEPTFTSLHDLASTRIMVTECIVGSYSAILAHVGSFS